MGAAGVVEVQLGGRGWAVQRLLGGVVEQDSRIATRSPGMTRGARADAVFEVACKDGGEQARPRRSTRSAMRKATVGGDTRLK